MNTPFANKLYSGTDKVERKLLGQGEKTSFRIFGLCRKDARTGVGDFVLLAREVQNNLDLSSDDISERISEIGAAYTIAVSLRGTPRQRTRSVV